MQSYKDPIIDVCTDVSPIDDVAALLDPHAFDQESNLITCHFYTVYPIRALIIPSVTISHRQSFRSSQSHHARPFFSPVRQLLDVTAYHNW